MIVFTAIVSVCVFNQKEQAIDLLSMLPCVIPYFAYLLNTYVTFCYYFLIITVLLIVYLLIKQIFISFFFFSLW